jgi:hypothetical protein
MHNGEADRVIEERWQRKEKARIRRLEVSRDLKAQKQLRRQLKCCFKLTQFFGWQFRNNAIKLSSLL